MIKELYINDISSDYFKMRDSELRFLLNKSHENMVEILGIDIKNIRLNKKVSRYIYLLMNKADDNLT